MEKDNGTLEMPWIENVSKQLRDKVTNVKIFNIRNETLRKKLRKGNIGLHLE